MDIIDFHTHAFPDSLADRAIATLEKEADYVWRAKLDGRVSSLLTSMETAGIQRSVVCPIATKPEQFDGILDWCLSIRSERIEPLASIHPDATDVAAQVRRVADAGLIGLKLHPMYQQFDLDEPRLDRLYAAVAESGLLVVFHCGHDIAFPGSLQAHPHRVAAVMDRHPKLRVVATHLGGFRAWDEVREHLMGRDLWLETSFSLAWMDAAEAVEIMRTHGTERLLFGTDSPWADQAEELQRMRDLPLSDEEAAAILGGNATGLLNH